MTTPEMSTAAQVDYIKQLLKRKIMPPQAPEGFDPLTYDPSVLTKVAASKFIGTLKALPERSQMSRKVPRHAVPESAMPEIQPGFYTIGRDVYKVVYAIYGSGYLYAKKLNPLKNACFEHAPGMMPQIREHGVPLTIAKAKELGKLYGRCVRCGRVLTADDSIHRMMGPTCYARMMDGN